MTTVLHPDTAGFDAARLGFEVGLPHTPSAIVAAESAEDVAAAVRLARVEGRRVAVQATGHGLGAVTPGAVLVSTAAMTRVEVDRAARIARVEAGATWGDVTAATAPHGLAGLSGSAPGVGVVGYLLSGGVSLLGRRYGWAADHVRAFEVVLADGSSRRVEGADADGLGWALRGGGGSFGIVTAVEIDLVPVARVYGGSLFLDAERAAAILPAWRDWAATAPDALGTSLAIVPIPDVEGPPPPLRGKTVVSIRVVFDGPADEGEALVAPLRATLGEPLLDGLGELPWSENASIHNDPPGPAASTVTTVALSALTDAALETIVDSARADGPRRVLELRRLGGALARGDRSPVRHDAEWSAGAISVLAVGPAALAGDDLGGPREAARANDAELLAALADATVGRLANFLGGAGADPTAVQAAYAPADWARLRAIKAQADPDDLIAASAPIPPAI